ncbi:CENP-A-nucleosome distal centromere subunit, CENP-P-domain-containing protein [Glomus cerebriforme]|uniref:CENP-A-nucleosome distal centromere subunit, CENP-P-domain-containing protein n=1 Tax=Glomus cerebriforme TaxID=658196 RepID=A0A397TH10_9GLOM|nr:CENP-A-nucleosome distal centromere subunit, CENP-P-domain-containing protein [Glomus cerebriforme]
MNKHPLKEKADSMAAKLSMITKEFSFISPPKNSLDKLVEDQQLMMIMEDEINNSQKEKSTLLLQIRKIKNEIEELQKNINRTCQENKTFLMSDQDALINKLLSINDQSLLMSIGTSLQVESRQQDETDNTDNYSLRARNIERLINFTKINFLKFSNNLIETDGDRIRCYNHIGNSYGINFCIEFEVNETNLVIRKLKIKVDSGVKREIGKLIENVERDKNLLIFFRGFIEYTRLNHQRKLLFDILKKKYPILTLPSFHSHNSFTQDISYLCVDVHPLLRFSDKSKIGPELILSWNLNITSSGHVLPDVQMYARMPHQWTLLDEKHIIDQIPSNFQNLAEIKGIQIAIEMIIKSLFKVREF